MDDWRDVAEKEEPTKSGRPIFYPCCGGEAGRHHFEGCREGGE